MFNKLLLLSAFAVFSAAAAQNATRTQFPPIPDYMVDRVTTADGVTFQRSTDPETGEELVRVSISHKRRRQLILEMSEQDAGKMFYYLCRAPGVAKEYCEYLRAQFNKANASSDESGSNESSRSASSASYTSDLENALRTCDSVGEA